MCPDPDSPRGLLDPPSRRVPPRLAFWLSLALLSACAGESGQDAAESPTVAGTTTPAAFQSDFLEISGEAPAEWQQVRWLSQHLSLDVDAFEAARR